MRVHVAAEAGTGEKSYRTPEPESATSATEEEPYARPSTSRRTSSRPRRLAGISLQRLCPGAPDRLGRRRRVVAGRLEGLEQGATGIDHRVRRIRSGVDDDVADPARGPGP